MTSTPLLSMICLSFVASTLLSAPTRHSLGLSCTIKAWKVHIIYLSNVWESMFMFHVNYKHTLTVSDLIWVSGLNPRARDHYRLRALEAGPRATHSYQANNLFIFYHLIIVYYTLCYVMILSASPAWKLMNLKKNIYRTINSKIHAIEMITLSIHANDYLEHSCQNWSEVGRHFL